MYAVDLQERYICRAHLKLPSLVIDPRVVDRELGLCGGGINVAEYRELGLCEGGGIRVAE